VKGKWNNEKYEISIWKYMRCDNEVADREILVVINVWNDWSNEEKYLSMKIMRNEKKRMPMKWRKWINMRERPL